MSKFRKILVTGGSAVAGSALKDLVNSGHFAGSEFLFIGSKECNLLDRAATLAFVDSCKPDAILHFAAISGGIGLSLKHPASMLRDNVMMNFNILEAARISNVKKVIMTLTTGMYDPTSPLPLREEYIHNGPPDSSNYGSSFAKRLVEPMIRGYREEYGMNVIGLVPNGIFGENDNFNANDATMVPTLIRRFYEHRTNEMNGTKSRIVIWGDGSPLREYTYSKDVARAYMWALDNYDEEQILHTGTTEELSVKEIAQLIAIRLGVDFNNVVFDISKPKGVYRKSTDNSRFVSLSNFVYTPFAHGLEYTIDWFVKTTAESPEKIRTLSKSSRMI